MCRTPVNGRIFPDSVLHRATYLHERTVPGKIADYAIDVEALLAATSRSSSAVDWIQLIVQGASQHTPEIHKSYHSSWVDFFPKLLVEPTEKHNKLRKNENKFDEAFMPAFRATATWLSFDINNHSCITQTGKIQRDIATALEAWFCSRAIGLARYVLYVSQKSSGLDYSKWVSGFGLGEDKANPWYEIAHEYPVLIRQIAGLYSQLVSSTVEMFVRLNADRTELYQQYGIPITSQLCALTPNLSDPHRGGRTVMRLHFEGGMTIIYKPKSIDIEHAFNSFVADRGWDMRIRSLSVLPRKGYGWVEDIGEPSPVVKQYSNSDAIGYAAAMLWFLNATDLHFENVRTESSNVTCLDLETLFAAPIPTEQLHEKPRWRYHSVSATMLFDANIFANERVFNISGFDPSPHIAIERPRVTFKIKQGELVLSVAAVDKEKKRTSSVESHDTQVVLEAFHDFANGSAREDLKVFVAGISEECTLRLVLRDTYFYGRMMERMQQPKFLRDAARISLDLASLHAGVSVDGKHNNTLHEIIEDEVRQLINGDIPYFSYKAGGKKITLSDDRELPLFEKDAKTHAHDKLQDVESSDIFEQQALIRIALGDGPPLPKPSLVTALSGPTCLEDSEMRFKKDLDTLALRIIRSAFCPSNQPARWLSLYGDVTGQDLKVGVGDREFFGGSWGILLALQATHSALGTNGNMSIRDNFLSQDAEHLEQITPCISKNKFSVLVPLGYSGVGGMLFAQSILVKLDPDRWGFLANTWHEILEYAEAHISGDRWHDVIGGSAGLILGIDRVLSVVTDSDLIIRARNLARLAVLKLIAVADTKSGRASWRTLGEDSPVLGYAHGWAGIVVAIHTARRILTNENDLKLIDACLEGASAHVEWELQEYGSWLDHRTNDNADALNKSWCNGVPGFLRGMLEFEGQWSNVAASEMNSLFDGIKAHVDLGEAIRFCCGDMGNADLILDLAKRSTNEELRKQALSIGQTSLVAVLDHDATTEDKLLPELVFPGLFQGQAGILYTCCRFLLNDLPSLSGQNYQILQTDQLFTV